MTLTSEIALLEIEKIKTLKARYCRFLDSKDWIAWKGLFADDFVSNTSEASVQGPSSLFLC